MSKDRVMVYAVFRSGIRVSDNVYETENDVALKQEVEHWQTIVDRWPDGTKISVEPISKWV